MKSLESVGASVVRAGPLLPLDPGEHDALVLIELRLAKGSVVTGDGHALALVVPPEDARRLAGLLAWSIESIEAQRPRAGPEEGCDVRADPEPLADAPAAGPGGEESP